MDQETFIRIRDAKAALRHARESRRVSEKAAILARRELREALRMASSVLSPPEIAVELGLTRQRVHILLKGL